VRPDDAREPHSTFRADALINELEHDAENRFPLFGIML
jgi:hypothetical protein